MGLIAAKCSQCGCKLEIDTSRQRNFCPACGTEFIQEKITNNQITNTTIQNQTNVYVTNKTPRDAEADANLLNLLFYSMDFDNLRQKSLAIVESDKNNKLAKALYLADFKIVHQINSIKLVEFQEKPMLDYFVENAGNIDLKFTEFMFGLFIRKVSNFDVNVVYQILMNNVGNLSLSDKQLIDFYTDIINDSCNINDNFIENFYANAAYNQKKFKESNLDFSTKEIQLIAGRMNENNTHLAEQMIKDVHLKGIEVNELSCLNMRYPIGYANGTIDKKKLGITLAVVVAFLLFMTIIRLLFVN